MKKLVTLLVIFLMCVTAIFAQAPQKFSYQAVVRNANNTLITGTQVGVRVSVLQGSAAGAPVYVETHTVSSNANGLVTLVIGDGSVINGVFENIDWADGPYFLKTETDPTGGTNYTIEGTQQLLSVPYAMYAGASANDFSGDYNDLTNTPDIPTVPANLSAFNNDAGYITSYTETDPTVPAWAKESNKPTYSYSEITNTPTIPTVPTNVGAFTNDAGYITSYTETDPTVPAWAKEANKPTYNYSEIANTPTIPTIPTNVSAFNNDAGYLTEYTEHQALSISNDTIFLTGGGYVKLPAAAVGFSGDYNDLTNTPDIPMVPTNVGAFTNDAGYLTSYTETDPTVPAWAKENNKPAYDYSEITNTPAIPTVPTNVSAFANDAGYITMDSIPAIPTVPTNVSAFTNDASYLSVAQCPDVDICAIMSQLETLQQQVAFLQSQVDSLINVADTNIADTSNNHNSLPITASYITAHGDWTGNAMNMDQFITAGSSLFGYNSAMVSQISVLENAATNGWEWFFINEGYDEDTAEDTGNRWFCKLTFNQSVQIGEAWFYTLNGWTLYPDGLPIDDNDGTHLHFTTPAPSVGGTQLVAIKVKRL